MRRFDFVTLNFLRTSLCAAVLAIPAVYFGLGGGFSYSVVSGFITLAIGDTLFLLAIREVGASIATPVVYTYVLFVQLSVMMIGESVPLANFASAFMVIAGVYILSRGGEGEPRRRGILYAIAAGLAWTAGQDLVAVATNAGGSVVAVTFTRDLSGAIALGIALLLTNRPGRWPASLSAREFGFLALIAISDLALASLIFVYSISVSGVALTVIVTSVSPFLVQVLSKVMGKESPSSMDFLGGIMIVAALILAVAF